MAKHKPMCLIVSLLVIIGAVNWGLTGLGGFLGRNLNVVNLILGGLPQVEWIVYLLVGLAGVASAYFIFTCKECACEKMDMKEMKK